MDYETTIYNKVITLIAKEKLTGEEEVEARQLIYWMQLTHGGLRQLYLRSMGQSESDPGAS
jgi:hypothetical protein